MRQIIHVFLERLHVTKMFGNNFRIFVLRNRERRINEIKFRALAQIFHVAGHLDFHDLFVAKTAMEAQNLERGLFRHLYFLSYNNYFF